MKKFNFLVLHGYKKRVFRKAFVISNIVIGIILLVLVNLPGIISLISSPDDEIENLNVLVIDEITNDNSIKDKFDELLNPDPENKFYILTNGTDDIIDGFWENNEYDIVVHFQGTIDQPQIGMYNKYGELDNILKSQIELLLISYKIDDYQQPTFIFNNPPDYENSEDAMILNSLTTFLILPLFILLVLAIQFVGVDIIEEKSTKAIETIISSVPAKTHFFSKILSSILFIITQGGLLIVYVLLATLIGSFLPTPELGESEVSLFKMLFQLIPNWPLLVVFTILFIIMGTFLYLVIASLFAAMATTQEDYQQFQTPIMLILLAGFYIGLFAPMLGATTLIKVASYIPLFSPIIVPIAFMTGAISTVEAIIALVVLLAFLVLITYLVAPVYRVAILSYDQTKLFTRIKSYFKKGFSKTK